MTKGLGIAALVIAILAIFIPLVGSWITIIAALLAAFAAGGGFGMGIAAIIVNFVHIVFLSPLLWASSAMMSAGAEHAGEDFVFLPWILLGAQAIAVAILIVLHLTFRKKEAKA